ncbi:hypothetical protein L195_g044811, partial [Trifolium pratense]
MSGALRGRRCGRPRRNTQEEQEEFAKAFAGDPNANMWAHMMHQQFQA